MSDDFNRRVNLLTSRRVYTELSPTLSNQKKHFTIIRAFLKKVRNKSETSKFTILAMNIARHIGKKRRFNFTIFFEFLQSMLDEDLTSLVLTSDMPYLDGLYDEYISKRVLRVSDVALTCKVCKVTRATFLDDEPTPQQVVEELPKLFCPRCKKKFNA